MATKPDAAALAAAAVERGAIRLQLELLLAIQKAAGDDLEAVTSDLMNLALQYGMTQAEVDAMVYG